MSDYYFITEDEYNEYNDIIILLLANFIKVQFYIIYLNFWRQIVIHIFK